MFLAPPIWFIKQTNYLSFKPNNGFLFPCYKTQTRASHRTVVWQARQVQNNLAISVIVPTYNRCSILMDCLTALEKQWLPVPYQFEIIVIDDHSTDETVKVFKEKKESFPRVKLLQLAQNGGPGRARNAGIIVSVGSLLVFVDSDVIVGDDFLLAHWKQHEQQLCLTVGPVQWVTHVKQIPIKRFNWLTDASRAFFCTSNAAVRKNVFIQAGMFDADFTKYGWEDLECGERLRQMGIPRYFIKHAKCFHVKPPLSILDWDRLIEQERHRGEMGMLFYRKHPYYRVRLMIQLTWIHRCLWLCCSIFGLLNEYSVRPLMVWLLGRRYYSIANLLWTIVSNRVTCETVHHVAKIEKQTTQ
eukprot:jgi/Galph1/3672/GphlegSOOS_G2337.1